MSGDMRTSREGGATDASGTTLPQCPAESVLLAYTRNQQLELSLSIRLHIEHCQSCRQKCDEYKRLNATLGLLASVQSNLRYPEPLANRVFQVIRREKRQSNKAPALSFRIASLPIALLLAAGALIVMTGVVVWALFIHTHGNGLSTPSTNHLVNGPPASTLVAAQNHPTQKPKPKPGPTIVVSPTAGANPIAGSTPYIALCSTPDDIAQLRMRICGHNFSPGDKIALVVDIAGSAPKQRHPVLVDAKGNFQDSFIINNCDVPLAIFARDLSRTANTNVLQNIAFADCPVPTPPASTGTVQHSLS